MCFPCTWKEEDLNKVNFYLPYFRFIILIITNAPLNKGEYLF